MEEERYDLDNYMLKLVDLMFEDQKGVRCDKFWKMEITEQGIPGKCNDQQIEQQKTLHEEDGSVTTILMSRQAKVGSRVKNIAEASAYRTEGISSRGTTREMGTTSTQAHAKAGWKNAESDASTAKLERRKTEDAAENECGVAAEGHISEGKLLVLLQVNCRSICNKILEFWNLIHIALML
jgi:hypothetical protein